MNDGEPKIEQFANLARQNNEIPSSILNDAANIDLIIDADAQGKSQNTVGKVTLNNKAPKVR